MKIVTRGLPPLFLLLVLLSIAWHAWRMVTPHATDRSARDHDEFVARYGKDFGLPATAVNIRFITSGVGLGGRAWICRFEAPVEDAKAYALSTYAGPGEQGPLPDFEPIETHPFKPELKVYGIKEVPWFDVENITEGITLPRDDAPRPLIWIDTKRGVYYGWWTD